MAPARHLGEAVMCVTAASGAIRAAIAVIPRAAWRSIPHWLSTIPSSRKDAHRVLRHRQGERLY
jgi:hypothetical protein